MLFNSLRFLIFFPVVICVCFLLPAKLRQSWLLAASYFFYMCWNAKYALLLFCVTAVTYAVGLLIDCTDRFSWSEKSVIHVKKLCAATGIVLAMGALFFFKYIGFVVDSMNKLLALAHVQLSIPTFDVLLPVGVSFYTFQAMGYVADVYRGQPAERNFVRYALFVSFFPQLVAGPIERSKDLLCQLKELGPPRLDRLQNGVLLMLWGYFLKVVLADRIAVVVDTVYANPAAYGGWYIVVATILFAFQIYGDFAGYSTIAMGAAEVLGVRLTDNFDAPYLSRSVGEFWRRWHVSLGSWFRDNLYIPLGGNRKGKGRRYLNLMVVFLASGLWHGADWSFVAWGGLNGLYQIAGALTKPLRRRAMNVLGLRRDSLGHKVLQTLITFALVDFAWIFFRAESLSAALFVIRSMFTVHNPWVLFDGSLYRLGLDQKNFQLMVLCILLLLAVDWRKRAGVCTRRVIAGQDALARWLVFAVSVNLILLLGRWGIGYDPASFIYFQF